MAVVVGAIRQAIMSKVVVGVEPVVQVACHPLILLPYMGQAAQPLPVLSQVHQNITPAVAVAVHT
jgi:hypothetical protein